MVTRPLRFCLITTFYPPYNFGGDGIFVQHLAQALGNRGHQVHVIHCLDSFHLLAQRAPAAMLRDSAPVTVHSLRSALGPLSPVATHQTGTPTFKSVRLRQILATGFDIIHYHNISLVGGPGILEYGRAIKLSTMHDYNLICPTNMLFKFNRRPCDDQTPPCLACTLWHRRPPQWWRYSGLLPRAVRQVDAFLAPSRFSQNLHRRRLGLNLPVLHLPNFVPQDNAAAPMPTETPGETPREKPYFLFVGRLEKLKGLQTLMTTFRHWSEARLLIAGAGAYEPTLRRLAEGCPNIEFLGQKTQGQLGTLYRQAVALIVPSEFWEIFPLVILEAFRQATPVVVRNLGGLPEIIQDSGGGLLYDTEAELARALKRLLEHPAQRAQMGRCGHQTYLRLWTPEAHLARYLDLIQEIAARREKHPAPLTPNPPSLW
jgi:glycosyltransferase involved in cell wall biosynthesis